jgi:Calcineurin-like phosphoesterase
MKESQKQGLSRTGLLKALGLGLLAIGLSPLTIIFIGCTNPPPPTPPPPSFLNGQEMVGKVTANASTIRLVAGALCQASTRFRLLYDTVSHSNPMDYAYQTSEVSGFNQNDPITFGLDSLSPSTQYYYRTGYDEGTGWVYRDEHSFHTQRAAGESFRFCIGTELHVFPYPSSWVPLEDQTYNNVLADSPDILISLGDDSNMAYQGLGHLVTYPWPTQEVLWWTIQWTRSIYDLACHSMFFLPVNGNHEGLYGWTTQLPQYQYIREGQLRYLPLPDSGTFPEGGDAYGRYGAFSWGDVLFIWLDVVGFCTVDPLIANDHADYVLGDDQKTFLQTTLANSSAPWKFVFAHHLFGGNDACDNGYGRGNANGAHQHDQGEIQNMMLQYGAQAFFYGHDHVFSVSEADGISYICAGNAGSGCPWSYIIKPCYVPYIIYCDDQIGKVIPGHVRVDVTSTAVTISYIKASLESDNGSVAASYIINR